MCVGIFLHLHLQQHFLFLPFEPHNFSFLKYYIDKNEKYNVEYAQDDEHPWT